MENKSEDIKPVEGEKKPEDEKKKQVPISGAYNYRKFNYSLSKKNEKVDMLKKIEKD